MSTSNSPIPPPDQAPQPVVEDPLWRESVPQTQRNVQVREIASVLASLEPGASKSSKLRLAMQFEDSVFKAASSLSDYRKKLSKRLKKVQKSYQPAAPDVVRTRATKLIALRQQYHGQLVYILQHAQIAHEAMRVKHGETKALQLGQYLDSVKLWAADVGINADGSIRHEPNTTLSEEQVTKLESQLERKLENIRSHVVKLADPNAFLVETLLKVSTDVSEKAAKILSVDVTKRLEQLQKRKTTDAAILLRESLERAQANVPLQQQQQQQQRGSADDQRKVALRHLDKMRAASTVLVAFMMNMEKESISSKEEGMPPKQNALTKAHTVALQGIDFVQAAMKVYRQEHAEPAMALDCAWRVCLEPPSSTDASCRQQQQQQQQKGFPPPCRSRILLTPHRKTPSHLLPALLRKGARLVRPPPSGAGTFLILDFEAFAMTIYLVPLLVTLRARPDKINSTSDRVCVDEAHMAPLDQGLAPWLEIRKESKAANDKESLLSVWGATGSYHSLGHVVEERLRDASARATQRLRQCFANATNNKDGLADYEVEILEATALLEFLQLARMTYTPDWQDVEET